MHIPAHVSLINLHNLDDLGNLDNQVNLVNLFSLVNSDESSWAWAQTIAQAESFSACLGSWPFPSSSKSKTGQNEPKFLFF